MLELRRNAESILRRVKHGERLILTYRGRPALRLEPLMDNQTKAGESDPFFKLKGLVEPGQASGMSNEDMDAVVYGH